jgi:hypothetical protein
MRTVLKNSSEVFHVWANQGQDYARSGNVSFDGRVAYSYRAVIGVMVGGPRGSAALITGATHSVTTSKHTGEAASAARLSFRLPGRVDRSTTPDDGRAQWAEQIADLSTKYAVTTRKPSKAKLLRELRGSVESANRLCTFFELPLFELPAADAEVDAYVAQLNAERIAVAKARAERDAAELAEQKAEALASLASWLAGAPGQPKSFHLLRGKVGDLMRVGADGEVETTQRAYVPVDHVREAAPLILLLVRAGRPWRPTGDKVVRLGHYRVDQLDEDGTLHVGCHAFKRAELERFAAVLGVA